MQFNWTIILLASIIPMIVGFIWYHPKVFGTAWMKTSGVTEESIKGGNMALIFGLSFVFAFLISLSLQTVVIHQVHIGSIFMGEPGIEDPSSEASIYMNDFMEKYGNRFRTFGHGSFHGFLFGLFIIFPIIATNALFERRSFKYTLINAGYWIISIMLMGGVLCAFA